MIFIKISRFALLLVLSLYSLAASAQGKGGAPAPSAPPAAPPPYQAPSAPPAYTPDAPAPRNAPPAYTPAPSAPPAYAADAPAPSAPLTHRARSPRRPKPPRVQTPKPVDGTRGLSGLTGRRGTHGRDQVLDLRDVSLGQIMWVKAVGLSGGIGGNGGNGGNGSHGGDGGRGGNGGDGGDGGNGGDLTIFFEGRDTLDRLANVVADLSGGYGGPGGEPGFGGRASDYRGSHGRAGRTGLRGARGKTGTLTLVPARWKHAYLGGELSGAKKGFFHDTKVVELQRVKKVRKIGAASLLHPESVVADSYWEVRVQSAAVRGFEWQARSDRKEIPGQTPVKYTLTPAGSVTMSVEGYLFDYHYDYDREVIVVRDFVKVDDVLGFSIGEISGELETLKVALTGVRVASFRNLSIDDICFKLNPKVSGFLWSWTSVMPKGKAHPVSREYIDVEGDVVTIRLGEWIQKEHPRSLWRLHRSGRFVTKRIKVDIEGGVCVKPFGDATVEQSKAVKVVADPTQDSKQPGYLSRVFEFVTPTSWI